MGDFNFVQQIMELFGPLRDAGAAIKPLSDGVDLLKKIRDLMPKGQDPGSTDPKLIAARELMLELQEKLLSARETEITTRAQLAEALSQLEMLRHFELKRDHYERVQLYPRSFAYRERNLLERAQSGASYCAHCFEQNSRLITLQLKERTFGRDTLTCTTCKGDVFQTNDLQATSHVMDARFNPFG